jgi:hypothetical protein
MSTKKAVSVAAASSLLAFLCLSPVYAEEKDPTISEMEKEMCQPQS